MSSTIGASQKDSWDEDDLDQFPPSGLMSKSSSSSAAAAAARPFTNVTNSHARPSSEDGKRPLESSHDGNEQLNPKQKEVLRLAQEGKSVFITGPAGTGKSVVLRHVIKHLKTKYAKNPSAWAVLGSTGTSAVAVGGQSLHSFAGCGIPVEVKDFQNAWRDDRRKAWRNLEVMLVDEVSMVSGEFLDHLSDVVCAIRQDKTDLNNKNHEKPFGGIQLILCGDFLQLPPIPKRTRDIKDMVDAGRKAENLHRDLGFAFQSKVWRDAKFQCVQLDQVFRQNNKQFIEVLHEIRKGSLSEEGDTFLQRCQRPLPPTKTGIKPTLLYCTNRKVKHENEAELAKLPTEAHSFVAEDGVRVDEFLEGVDRRWAESTLRNNDFFQRCIADSRLTLKVGAQVMLIKNHDLGAGLVNGSRGKVVDFAPPDDDNIDASTDSTSGQHDSSSAPSAEGRMKYPVVDFVNGQRMVVVPVEFSARLAGIGECVRTAVPLKLAWAMTVHKSQGMTLDYVVVDLHGVFSDAQAYVALSRASDEDGLELRNFQRKVVRSDKRALDFYGNPGGTFRLWSETLMKKSEEGATNDAPLVLPKPIAGCLDGLAFVFTGEFSDCSRGQVEELAKSCGGLVRSAVSGKTNFLVTGMFLDDGREASQGTKYKKASKIIAGANKSKLKILGQRDFFALVTSRSGKRSAGDAGMS